MPAQDAMDLILRFGALLPGWHEGGMENLVFVVFEPPGEVRGEGFEPTNSYETRP